MKYKLMLVVAFIGLGLFFTGSVTKQTGLYWGGVALTGSMFFAFLAMKFARRQS